MITFQAPYMHSTTSMNRFNCLAICGLALLQALVAGINVPYYFQPAHFTRRDLSVTKVQRELGPLLSKTSAIFGPSDARYDNVTERWDAFLTPDVEIVAQAGQESDISVIVGAFPFVFTKDAWLTKALGQILQCK